MKDPIIFLHKLYKIYFLSYYNFYFFESFKYEKNIFSLKQFHYFNSNLIFLWFKTKKTNELYLMNFIAPFEN